MRRFGPMVPGGALLKQVGFLYQLREPRVDGHTELYLTPHELLEPLSQLVTPPRVHKYRYCGVLAPNARLRSAVIESAGPAGATLQVLERAGQAMGLVDEARRDDEPRSGLSRAAWRCWAMLLARLFECLHLRCPHCGHPMRIIACVADRPVIERLLRHMDEPIHPPEILPSRSPPQLTISLDQGPDLGMNQDPGPDSWPDLDQSGGGDQDTWV